MSEYLAPRVRTCGRPTKAGHPCKQHLHSQDEVACKLHAAEEDRALGAARKEGWDDGYAWGQELGKVKAKFQIEELERLRKEVTELKERLQDAQRYYQTADGEQVVEVEGGYSYRWGGEKLKVGDRVLLPENYLSKIKRGPGPFESVVTRLGSTYHGTLSFVVRKIS